MSTARKGVLAVARSARWTTGSAPSGRPASSRASCMATPGWPRDASHRGRLVSASSPPSAAASSSSLRPPSRSSGRSPSGLAVVASTATGAVWQRAATAESIPAASAPPRSTSSMTMNRSGPDARCAAAPSRSSGPACSLSRPAIRPSGAPVSRSSRAHAMRPGCPSAGLVQSTSKPRSRAPAAADSAISVLPDPAGPQMTSTPPAPRRALSSRRPTSSISWRRPATSTPSVYQAAVGPSAGDEGA